MPAASPLTDSLVGGGHHDDTALIQAMITGRFLRGDMTLDLPAGVFACSDLSVPVVLRGRSWNNSGKGTWLKRIDGSKLLAAIPCAGASTERSTPTQAIR